MKNLKPWQKRLFVGLSLSIVAPSTLVFGSKVYSQSLPFLKLSNQKLEYGKVQKAINTIKNENQQIKKNLEGIKKELEKVDEGAKLTANEINKKTQDEKQELESIAKELAQVIKIVQEIPGLEKYTLENDSRILDILIKIAKENQDVEIAYREVQKHFESRQTQSEAYQGKSEDKQRTTEKIAFQARSKGDNEKSSNHFTQSQKYYKIAQIFLKKSRFFLREAVLKTKYQDIIVLLQKQQQYKKREKNLETRKEKYDKTRISNEKSINTLKKDKNKLARKIIELKTKTDETQLAFYFNLFFLALCIACIYVLLLYVMQPNQLRYFIDEDMANNIVKQRNKALEERNIPLKKLNGEEKNKRSVRSIKRHYYKEAFLAIFTCNIIIRIDNLINSNKRQK